MTSYIHKMMIRLLILSALLLSLAGIYTGRTVSNQDSGETAGGTVLLHSDSTVIPHYPGRKVWSGNGPDFRTGDISPDGRYFTDINWDNGDLELVDLETGQRDPLTGWGYDTGVYAWSSSFSPDGQQLAVSWYNYEPDSHELYIHSVEGGRSRLLISARKDIQLFEPLDWSPEGDQILLALHAEKKDWQLGLVSPEDGYIRILKTLDWQAPGGAHPQAYPHAAWSPDGRLIAYDYPSDNPDHQQDIVAISPDGTRETVLVGGPGSDRVVDWNSDGSRLFFYSDRSGEPALWSVPVENGKVTGPPEMLASGLYGMQPLGYTQQGLAYGVSEGTWNTYVAAVDIEAGRLLKEPWPVDQISWHRNTLGDWSPDGSQLLYITFEPPPDPVEKAVIISLTGERNRTVPFPRNFHNKTGTVAWVSENRVLLDGITSEYSGIRLFNLATGDFEELPDFGEKGFFRRFKTNPDGSQIYVVMRGSPSQIVAMDTRTGAQRIVHEANLIPVTLAVSPSGEELAYITRPDSAGYSSLKIVDISSGNLRTVLRKPARMVGQPLTWSADGKRFLVGARPDPHTRGLWSLPVEGGTNPVFIDLPEAFRRSMEVNPEGRHIAFQSGENSGSIRMFEIGK